MRAVLDLVVMRLSGSGLEGILRQLLGTSALGLKVGWVEAEARGGQSQEGLLNTIQGALGIDVDTVDNIVEQGLVC